jgi:type VI secretion system secreted protein Hcp
MGKTLPKAVFEFMRADSDGKPICYYKITLENVMVSGITFDSSSGGIINEQVHLAYAKTGNTRTSTVITPPCSSDTNMAGSWRMVSLPHFQ